MGQKIVLADATFTDNTLPKVYSDALMSKGSLFLFDPGHSRGGFTGVPATGATVPNVAWETAAALLGSGSAASLSALIQTSALADIFMVERSSKGGVHGISTQAGAQTLPRYWFMTLPSAIRDYVFTNAGSHTFYVSLWKRVTRKGLTTSTAPQSHMHFTAISASTTNYLFHSQGGKLFPPGAPSRRAVPDLYDNDASLGAPLNKYMSGSVQAVTGTGPSAGHTIQVGVGAWDAWGSLNYNKAASAILYRAYIEDLTVSGRTAAEVDALDYAMFQAAFAAGGKFYGDTYTDPATMP